MRKRHATNLFAAVVIGVMLAHGTALWVHARQPGADRASIQGTITDAATGLRADAIVTVISRNPPREVRTRTVPTSNGSFHVDRLFSGNATLVVRAEGFAPAAETVDLAGDAPAMVTISVQRAGSIRGVVVGPDGAPVARARVVPVYPASVPHKPLLEGYVGGRLDTRDDGVFLLRNLVPGVPIRVTAIDAKNRRASTTIVLRPGEQIDQLQLQFITP